FECLTGRPAFVGENIVALLAKIVMEEPPRSSELRAGVPEALDDLVATMLRKSPADRFADGAAARAAITTIADLVVPDVEAAAVPMRRSAITRGEQHVVSVVIAGRARHHAPRATEDIPLTVDDPAQRGVARLRRIDDVDDPAQRGVARLRRIDDVDDPAQR